MPQLAPAAVEVVKSSGIGQRRGTHPSNLRRLWPCHTWLLQHGLCDDKGLEGLISKQMLQQGQKEALFWATQQERV